MQEGVAFEPNEVQLELLRWLIAGKRDPEIAQLTNTKPETVRVRVFRMLNDMGANTRAGAVAIVLRDPRLRRKLS